jgi:diguanylate cyclase (GGDEF)-like protein/PAS domain S-box-containing protein
LHPSRLDDKGESVAAGGHGNFPTAADKGTMHSRRPQGTPARDRGLEAASEVPDLRAKVGDHVAEVSPARPFLERRLNPAIGHSWPEALESLHRLLQGYENANKLLVEAESRYRGIFEDAPVGIFQLNAEGKILSLNSEMARIFGYPSPEEFLAENSMGGVARIFDPHQWTRAASTKEGKVHRFDLQVANRDGETKWVRFNLREIREQSRLVRYDGSGEDITERKQIEVRTERLAYFDLLTGLPNKTLLHDQLAKVLSAAARKKCQVALLLLQLDRFKVINDSLGVRFGDRLLQEIADRIIVGAGRNRLVARIGGAEFAIVVEDAKDLNRVISVAENIVNRLGAEYSFFGHSLNVFCNLGISLYPKDGCDCEALIKTADIAMNCAREDGLNRFRIFTDAMNDKVQESLRMEHGLQVALARNELFLVYQPQVDIRSGEVTGLEALLRWNHPQFGIIPPGKFIGVAELSGLIVPIGEWVLRTACAQARKWQDEGLPAVPIAVNVSAIQFRQQGFGDLIRSVLRETGLDPKYLELELTESLLLSNADVMFSILQDLKDMGVMLAIDDFGTGYSSLAYLRQFKVNRLKIARTFIQDVSVDTDDAAITTAIINMAKALNLAVLAEGVENRAQLSFLEAQQCYTIQGFYFSKPVAVDQIDRHLRSGFSHLASPLIQ